MKLRHVNHLPRVPVNSWPYWLSTCPIRTHLFLPRVCFSKLCHLEAFHRDWAEGEEGKMCVGLVLSLWADTAPVGDQEELEELLEVVWGVSGAP